MGEVIDILIFKAAIYLIGKAVCLMRKAVRPHRHNPMDRHNPVAHVMEGVARVVRSDAWHPNISYL